MTTISGKNSSADMDSLIALILKRTHSMIDGDIRQNSEKLRSMVRGKRILVIGGGGSIGSSTTELIVELCPQCVHVVDINENYLAELVRNIRLRSEAVAQVDFRTLPFDFGSPIMQRYIFEERPYDIVLNFAALKHVRSEKNVFSILQMIDTNVVKQARFKRWLSERGGCQRYFVVSTDKAANPTSLMGATKRLMEDVIFDVALRPDLVVTSARFANVAFSNGSLLQSFLYRISAGQPLAAPRETRRYFVSQREAGEICLLAALVGQDRHIYFPRLDPEKELRPLTDIAIEVMNYYGLQQDIYDDEAAARRDARGLIVQGRLPLILTPLDTSGEKSYEEFLGHGELEAQVDFNSLNALIHSANIVSTTGLVEWCEGLITNPSEAVDKRTIVQTISAALPNFQHVETGRSLDDRI
ncbi:polysaccharide biosynthesis protein [Bradyrhizobium sp. CB1650]|uniref:polysaccharide biosynthesis protein n=1 Tax=Bradyrhizobium sp. CB1650 TaxID=3039153 RepID=UPI002435C536|nr:polysaccharide biosynthesis protein [Bradyrhizobium sp. CB1650]WGD55348.1 polysaccharide biosynthesis protein [Bradyrhizobium sp. CB1650]